MVLYERGTERAPGASVRGNEPGCRIIYTELPLTIGGALTEVKGEPVIVINSLLSLQEQERALRHEQEHLRADHLHRSISLADAERDARRAESL